MPKLLDRADAEEYIRIHAQAAVLATRLDELKKKLLPQLVDGAVSPPDLVCLLVNRPQNKKQSDWKGYAFALLTKLYRRATDPKGKAQAELDAAEAGWPSKETPALHVVINPEYFERPA